MLRVIGLALIVVTGAAKVAQAENQLDGPAARAIETAAHHSPSSARDSRLRLQIGSGLAFAPIGQEQLRRSGHLDFGAAAPQKSGGEGQRQIGSGQPYGRSEALNLGAASKPSLAYPVTSALSLGVDYRFQSGESLNFKVAKVGGLEPNYHSHNFMIEARLEF
jgi:hypothetical protein